MKYAVGGCAPYLPLRCFRVFECVDQAQCMEGFVERKLNIQVQRHVRITC